MSARDNSNRFGQQFARFRRLGDIPPACATNTSVVIKAQLDWKTLGRLKTLSWLSQDQLQGLAQSLTIEKVKRRETIFFEGEAPTGSTCCSRAWPSSPCQNREERVSGWAGGTGEIFGVSSLLPHATRPFRCEAFSDCIRWASHAPRLSSAWCSACRWSASAAPWKSPSPAGGPCSSAIPISSVSASGSGLAGALLELGMKFGAEDFRGILLTLKVTHADLAELVGASRQRTTEQLNDFENEQRDPARRPPPDYRSRSPARVGAVLRNRLSCLGRRLSDSARLAALSRQYPGVASGGSTHRKEFGGAMSAQSKFVQANGLTHYLDFRKSIAAACRLYPRIERQRA